MAKYRYRVRGHNAKGRSLSNGQYINLPYSMLHTQAWRSLSGPAIKVFLELRSRFNGFNNGELSLSFEDAASLLGMSKTTVDRAYRELDKKGFIIKRKQGHWYGRMATEWQATDQKYKDQLATRDWQKWRRAKAKKQKSGTHTDHIPA